MNWEVTFNQNKQLPVYGWLYFKEGFSRDLVFQLFERFDLKPDKKVIDPFCGSGTTLLASQETGLCASGYDISPLMVFVSKVKLERYDKKNTSEIRKSAVFSNEGEILSNAPLIPERIIPRFALREILNTKNNIMRIEDQKIRNFLLLGLIITTHRILENTKKREELGKKPVKNIFKATIKRMIRDVENRAQGTSDVTANVGDARSLPIEDETVDIVITSPPYLNKEEYKTEFRAEETLFGDVIGWVGHADKKEYGINVPPGIIPELDESANGYITGYFNDIYLSLKELFRVCREGSRIGIVIGGGCFPNGVIQCDTVTAELAKEAGFLVEDILVCRNIVCTKRRTEKIGLVRESIVLLRKDNK